MSLLFLSLEIPQMTKQNPQTLDLLIVASETGLANKVVAPTQDKGLGNEDQFPSKESSAGAGGPGVTTGRITNFISASYFRSLGSLQQWDTETLESEAGYVSQLSTYSCRLKCASEPVGERLLHASGVPRDCAVSSRSMVLGIVCLCTLCPFFSSDDPLSFGLLAGWSSETISIIPNCFRSKDLMPFFLHIKNVKSELSTY